MKLLWALPMGVTYASLLILTHDALHHTLTGWKAFDEVFPRLISYVALWPHGLYKELHMLHHKLNGRDTNDPERVQWTEEEYGTATAFGRWRYRNRLWLGSFVFTGFGFIAHHVAEGIRLGRTYPRVRTALRTDTIYIVLLNGAIYGFAATRGLALEHFLTWMCLTYVAGGVLFFRAHVEHYGLWSRWENPLVGQIFNSRNVSTWVPVSWFFNRLNYHSAHHAYPRVPFYHLPEVHRRLQQFFDETPLPQTQGYGSTGWRLSGQLALIPKEVPLTSRKTE